MRHPIPLLDHMKFSVIELRIISLLACAVALSIQVKILTLDGPLEDGFLLAALNHFYPFLMAISVMMATYVRIVTRGGKSVMNAFVALLLVTEKHNKYAGREALDVLNRQHRLFEAPVALTQKSTAKQAKIKRFLKEAIYNRIPFEISAFAYFLFRYVIQLGFLDGREGLVYHVLQGFWYRFLVGAKLREMEAAIQQAKTVEERRSVVARLSRQELN